MPSSVAAAAPVIPWSSTIDTALQRISGSRCRSAAVASRSLRSTLTQ